MDNSRILIVEDERIIAMSIKSSLQKFGYEAAGVTSGENAIMKARDFRPALVLMDIMLEGEMDGIEAAERIRAMYDIPVIYLTAYADEKTLERVKTSEPFGYLTKPFEEKELLSAIEIALYRHGMEKKLKESENRFRTIVETVPDSVHLLDSNGTLLQVNRKGLELFEADSKEQLLGKSIYDFVLPKYVQPFRTLTGKVFSGAPASLEFEIEGMKGEHRWLSCRSAPLRNEKSEIIAALGIARDLTESKKLQEQLCQAQKMEALGQLAGGVAHDFNNILSAIIGYGDLLQVRIQDDLLRSWVEQIIASAERAAGFTQNLLAFSRSQVINPTPVSLNSVVTGMENLLSRLIGEDIELKFELTGRNTAVVADKGQIEQVLMNLATNARDAMPRGGVLKIRTDVVDSQSAPLADSESRPEKKWLRLSVSDSGAGIDEKTRKRIFEPFFTTKEAGTGLGLSIVYGIIRQHGGYIDLESREGGGSIFCIYLPVVTADTAEKEAGTVAALTGGSETVLVAEDDEELRRVIRTILEQYGYLVLEASEGEDAVRKFSESHNAIDLLLLDVILPKKSGIETLRDIATIRPDVRSIFMSGYPADMIRKKGFNGKSRLLLKPLSKKALLESVREALDSRALQEDV